MTHPEDVAISLGSPLGANAKGFEDFIAWDNLIKAFTCAAKGKKSAPSVAAYNFAAGENLLALQHRLQTHSWEPGPYVHFNVHQPKRRLISAAPFCDRIVHHALCQILEPRFEPHFIADSYANRVGKGSHRAVSRLQQFSQRFRYVLRLDVKKHFPSIDHEILKSIIWKRLPELELRAVITRIISSGNNLLSAEASPLFPEDDLLALTRPRGLPIGNLTSQFWSNCYLDSLDHFARRQLGCPAYLRYVDDFALFHNDKSQLAMWRDRIIAFLAQQLRLTIHENSAQVADCKNGIPWLGFVIYPTHKRLKARKVVFSTKRLNGLYKQWQLGEISFATFDAAIQGWINHARFANTWGLRRHVLQPLRLS